MLWMMVLIGNLPEVEDSYFESIRSDLVEYTSLPKAYVHNGTAHSPSYNISAVQPQEPFGNANREFPWNRPLGIEHVPNAHTKNYRYFPPGKKIVIQRVGSRGAAIPTTTWAWRFPEGTTFVEAFYQRHDGRDYPWLILSRTKTDGEWMPRAFSPFPTRKSLERVIGRIEPDRMIGTLRNRHDMRLVDTQKKDIPVLPDLPDSLVKVMLSWPFRPMDADYFENTFLPTSRKRFNLVPGGYSGGAVDLDSKSCMQCHRSAGMHVDLLERNRDWYGHVRGSDGIFSWHPFDPRSISGSGSSVPVRFRQEIVHLLDIR